MELLDEVRDYQERLLQDINMTTFAPTSGPPTFAPTTFAPTLAPVLDGDRKKEQKGDNGALLTPVSAVRRGVGRRGAARRERGASTARARRALDERGRACPRSSRRLTLAPVPLTPFVAREDKHFW